MRRETEGFIVCLTAESSLGDRLSGSGCSRHVGNGCCAIHDFGCDSESGSGSVLYRKSTDPYIVKNGSIVA